MKMIPCRLATRDIAANAWTEQDGGLVLLVAKADAWTELGKLVKLGRVRIQLNPNPFAGTTNFVQILKLENGIIELKSGENTVRVWIDANHPVMHVETHLEHPGTFQANLELWRTSHPFPGHSPDKGGLFEMGGDSIPVNFTADTVFPAGADRITWCHFNTNSIYPFVLQQEHLESLVSKYPDPLLHRCFGGTLTGPGLVSSDDRTLKSVALGQNFRLDLIALTQKQVEAAQTWQRSLDALVKEAESERTCNPLGRHINNGGRIFGIANWIHVSGTDAAAKVSQGYVMQRYMIAASSRGELPVKFNGGLFTVGHDLFDTNRDSNDRDHNPDYRAWGNSNFGIKITV